ncbi:MAG: LacI family transcriptional regulator [Dorea sp.]|jgi:LacI family transcriptional regulator|nr:LacI family transcriptional regulator [Dorea sp.]
MSVTIYDVAQYAGVSLSTVSRVLNNSGYVKQETREKIYAAIDALNYIPSTVARSLSKNESHNIAVVTPDITNPFFGEVIKGITKELDQTDFDLIFYNTNENVQKELNTLQSIIKNRVRGLIITPVMETSQKSKELLKNIQKMNIPIVLIDRDISGLNCDGVFIDNVTGAYEATKLLLTENHRRIAIIHGPMSSIPGRDRLEGYLEAYRSINMVPPRSLQYTGNFMYESGVEATKKILKSKKHPTAIFCCNNLMTLGCLSVLKENNLKIPDDFAVVGFDEFLSYDVISNPITVVARATIEMGALAVHTLLGRIRQSSEPDSLNRIILQPHLKIRGSEKLIP